jgi:hypothetical protein
MNLRNTPSPGNRQMILDGGRARGRSEEHDEFGTLAVPNSSVPI